MAERPRAADDFAEIGKRLAEIRSRQWHDDATAAAPGYAGLSSRSAVNKEGARVWCTAIDRFNNTPRCHNGGTCCRNEPAVADSRTPRYHSNGE